ncbi:MULTISPECIES: fimbria/pilus periplasmic chaperone [Providencia]|uniref:Fimbria/pilus periplasmic chaperone n=1 Tax=Providencia rettgeri TaxID=587 RepID=A0A264VQR7_PRORE|nr:MULTISPECIES: fimbria/pilus periplasmic chaperone [Providencia]EFE52825.1 gram-negative pili assembly chaperone domain protein [Providencia rettgeri DSM 1131]EHZ6873005.1 fimbria/pilus periplasmic chaperone [Providencia rettgeri]MBG5891980.1 fimbria/pilus periplasmic chaperone [Providencia rettgeri]MBG5929006.1 fimbria/pilus periplasmic chaperone [Providencia rettgeri]MBI6190033.1 fimbria/pilus periplasmic chaperone [Providencia rettgeri]
MKLNSPFLLLTSVFTLTISVISAANAAVTLDRTRIIFDGNQSSINITIRNDNPELPYLAQSWLENALEQKLETGPIIATPPIQRMEPKSTSLVRLSTAPDIAKLPQDRESLFYYNLREIPPKSSEAGVLQIALQSRVKLFYRPESIVAQSKTDWTKYITLTATSSGYTLDNPTPFYLTVIGIGNSQKQSEESDFDAVMIPPKSNQLIKSSKFSTPYLTYINDYGGKPSLAFKCQASKCSVTE